jgi:hypothetical protein
MDLFESRVGARVSAPARALPEGRVGILVAAVVAGLTALRIAYVAWGGLDLSPDEAH